MRNKLLGLFAGAALTFVGCGPWGRSHVELVTLQEKVLPHANPTSYEFDATVNEVKKAIKGGFDKWRGEQWKRYEGRGWRGSGDDETRRALSQALQHSGLVHLGWGEDGILVSEDLPNKPGNENDAYISGLSPLGESEVYFKDGQPLIYFADFHIHLTEVGPRKTRVEIFAYHSRVLAGLDRSWSPHGPSGIFVEVPPTTIEQYQFLLRIGDQLGAKHMPPLVTPAPDAPIKELTLPRER